MLHVLFHMETPLRIFDIVEEGAVKAAIDLVDVCIQHAAYLYYIYMYIYTYILFIQQTYMLAAVYIQYIVDRKKLMLCTTKTLCYVYITVPF